jgi:hypothetical protein
VVEGNMLSLEGSALIAEALRVALIRTYAPEVRFKVMVKSQAFYEKGALMSNLNMISDDDWSFALSMVPLKYLIVDVEVIVLST